MTEELLTRTANRIHEIFPLAPDEHGEKDLIRDPLSLKYGKDFVSKVPKPNPNYLTFTTRLDSLLKQDFVYDQPPYRTLSTLTVVFFPSSRKK